MSCIEEEEEEEEHVEYGGNGELYKVCWSLGYRLSAQL